MTLTNERLLSFVCRRGACHLDACTGYVPLTKPSTTCECECHSDGARVGDDSE